MNTMSSASAHKPTNIDHPVSIGGLADMLGVPRQRVYNLVRRGQVRAEPMSGGLVVQPKEAMRVLDAAIRIDTRRGRNRLVFDFV
jgi:hypothetical protein